MMTMPAKSATKRAVRNGCLKIYFDGGCRPNPGQMETAVVAQGQIYLQTDCGIGTSNDAEWLALIQAVKVAKSIGASDVVLLGDSIMVIKQATLSAQCRNPGFKAHLQKFQSLAADFECIRTRKIARTQNLAGIALAKARR
jgi:ribonuclease HI